jgi:hypothetical protein
MPRHTQELNQEGYPGPGLREVDLGISLMKADLDQGWMLDKTTMMMNNGIKGRASHSRPCRVSVSRSHAAWGRIFSMSGTSSGGVYSWSRPACCNKSVSRWGNR